MKIGWIINNPASGGLNMSKFLRLVHCTSLGATVLWKSTSVTKSQIWPRFSAQTTLSYPHTATCVKSKTKSGSTDDWSAIYVLSKHGVVQSPSLTNLGDYFTPKQAGTTTSHVRNTKFCWNLLGWCIVNPKRTRNGENILSAIVRCP